MILLLLTTSLQGMYYSPLEQEPEYVINCKIELTKTDQESIITKKDPWLEKKRETQRKSTRKARNLLKKQVAEGNPQAIERLKRIRELQKIRSNKSYTKKASLKQAEAENLLAFIKQVEEEIELIDPHLLEKLNTFPD